MTPIRRSGPPPQEAAPTKTTTNNSSHAADMMVDLSLVDKTDKSIWAALFAGEFRLAVPCSRCGRWLVAAESKKNGLGPTCASREAE